MANITEKKAIKFVEEWAKRKKVKFVDRQLDRVGYDCEFHYRDGKIEKIEVKGTEKEHKIPDMSISEFDDKKRLIADFLYVVGNISKKKILYIIKRNEIPPDNLRPKGTYRIERFQGKKNMDRFKVWPEDSTK